MSASSTSLKEWFSTAVSVLSGFNSNEPLNREQFLGAMEQLHASITHIAVMELAKLQDAQVRNTLIEHTYEAVQQMKENDTLTLTKIVTLPFFQDLVRSDATDYHEWLVSTVVPRSLSLMKVDHMKNEEAVLNWFALAQETILTAEQLENFRKNFESIPSEVQDRLMPARIKIGKGIFAEYQNGQFTAEDIAALSHIFQAPNPRNILRFANQYYLNIQDAGEHAPAWQSTLINGWSVLEKKFK